MTKANTPSSKPIVPKYIGIGETLIKDILSKTYALHSLLPTEKQLCEKFTISRHTARESLRYVEKTGLVERKQGSGTIVIRNSMPEKMNQFINSVNDLLQFGQNTRFNIKVSDVIQLNNQMALLLDTDEGENCIHVGGLRIEPHAQKPICYSNIYRLPHMDAVDEELKDKKTAIYAVMKALDDKNIGKIEQQISACLIPKELAKQLNTDPCSAAMKITRRYFGKKEDLILVAESIYPAERFSFSTILFPNE